MASGAMRSIGAVTGIAAASAIVFLLVFVTFDQGLEPIEAGGPELLPLPKPPLGFLERLRFDADEVCAALLAPRDKARLLEHLHVLGSAGERHREGLGKLADRFFTQREAGEHSAPRRIRQRAERRIESILNHKV